MRANASRHARQGSTRKRRAHRISKTKIRGIHNLIKSLQPFSLDKPALRIIDWHHPQQSNAIRADQQAGDAGTLSSANAYTDARFNALGGLDAAALQGRMDVLEDRFETLDDRLDGQDRRIDRQGAMGAAMLNMAINAAGSSSDRGRLAVGAGFQGGEQALSVGYGKRIGSRASFSLGGAFSGNEKSAGIGFGVDL